LTKAKFDDTLMEHVSNNVPAMYTIEVSKLEDRLGNLTDPLMLEDIRAVLSDTVGKKWTWFQQ
jgi:hypothetical protein